MRAWIAPIAALLVTTTVAAAQPILTQDGMGHLLVANDGLPRRPG